MSLYGSQRALHSSRRSGSRTDLTGGGTYYERSEVVHGGGNGYGPPEYVDGYYSLSKTSMGGGQSSPLGAIHNKAYFLQGQCQEYLRKAELALQSGGDSAQAAGDAERYMGMAKEIIEQLKSCAMELRHMGQPNDNVVRSVEMCRDQLRGVHMALSGTMQRKSRSSRGSAGGWEDAGRNFNEALAWISQQKRLIETSSWGDDVSTIEQQLFNHSKFHSSIQRNSEVDRAREELMKKGDKANLHALEQEWDSLQKMSFGRTNQLRELQHIIEDISREIMWVNEREEEELVFDWGDRNIDTYIPKKQESYSKLMSALEEKEKDLNKVKVKVDVLLKNNHPASDKIEAYMDTLQTQWSWLLQITKCIHVHLKENAMYSQFFKEANETYCKLQMEHEYIRKKFTCDKNTPLENLMDLLKILEKEKDKLMENKMQVKRLVSKSKDIVRLKPRNPEEKGNATSPVIVKALCDFKQDQRAICKDNEAILKDNSQRSKWQVTGPGGLEMVVPSVCLLVPPPNPLSISLANKNEQYYEAILAMWNQFYINIKSLISWQHCLIDIKRINSFTLSMLANMRSDEYRSIIRSLEQHFEEFKLASHGSQMFEEEDKRSIESQYTGAQAHYEDLVVQLPTYTQQQQQQIQQVSQQQETQQQQVIFLQQQAAPAPTQLIYLQQQQSYNEQAAREQTAKDQAAKDQAAREHEAREQAAREQAAREQAAKEQAAREQAAREQAAREQAAREQAANEQAARLQAAREQVAKREEILRAESTKPVNREVIRKKEVKVVKEEPARKQVVSSSHTLTELHALRLKLEAAESSLSQHIHICLGEDGVHECGLRINQLEVVQRDIDSIRGEYLRMKERILKDLEGMMDSDKAQFLRSELSLINQRLGSLESSSSAYLQRLRALRALLESIVHTEDLVKVHEARLTEKETTSLTPGEVEDYMYAVKNMKVELDQRRDLLSSMETELKKATHWDGLMGGSSHRCDMMLSKYSEQVSQLSDRWRRIQNQMDCRLKDLESYLPQLQHYKRSSTSLREWISTTRKKLDAMQATKIDDIKTLNEHITQQKAMHSEIKSKRDTVESVLRDIDTCGNSIKDHELELASYSYGLETLLNIPVKRTLLQSPSTELTHEATLLHTHYIELLTLSGDYYRYLGEMLKNFEELKMRNTRIDLLEEELRLLKDDIKDRNAKNQSLEEAIARYRLDLSESQNQLLSVEEVKRNTALQCSTTRDSLESTKSQLANLNDQLARLNNQIEDEKRKRKLAEERFSDQQVEYESVLRRRQKELDEVNWAKLEVEKSVTDKEREAEQLRRQLALEEARVKELELQLSKTTSLIQSTQLQYNEMVRERDALLLKLKLSEDDRARNQSLEEDLNRIKMSLESEQRQKRLLVEENEKVKKDLLYWQSQNESKESLVKQHNSDKERLEQERNGLKREIERLMRELALLEEKHTSNLRSLQTEMVELKTVQVTMEKQLSCAKALPSVDPSMLFFDGVRKPVNAQQLLDCGVLDKLTFNQLIKGEKIVPEVAEDKKICLKGTGPIAGVFIGPKGKKSFKEAKKENLMSPDSADLLLDAQAATGHIIDPKANKKLTVEEACDQGVVDEEDRARLLEVEAAAVGYRDPKSTKPLSTFQAMKKGIIDKNTALRLLQAQESVGGILDPIFSVFLPKDMAIERGLIDEDMYRCLNQRPECYLDPATQESASYVALKRKCDKEPCTGLLLLPVPDLSEFVFDGVRKPVTAQQLLDCGVLDQPTFNQLIKGQKTVPDVAEDIMINLKGTGPIAGVDVGQKGKKSLTEAKKESLMSPDSADLLLDAQAATGHIIDPKANKKLTVEEAVANGVVDKCDKQRLLAAEAAAIGYRDPNTNKPLSAFQAMKKGIIEKNTALRLLQAQQAVGGILDPVLSVFLPVDTAKKRDLIDDDLCRALSKSPDCYLDPDTQQGVTYESLKKTCKAEPTTGLLLLPAIDTSSLVFDGVRKPVTAQQLLECGVLDQPTFNQLIKGQKTVPEVSVDKKLYLKGTGIISGVAFGLHGKMSLTEAKNSKIIPPESANLLLDAQAATGHIIDPLSNQKLTVEEAAVNGIIDKIDQQRLLTAELAAVGYQDPNSTKPLSVYQAMKKGLTDKKTALRLLQAQEAVGGVLDPVLSVFLPVETAKTRDLIDHEICQALKQSPECYQDPNTQKAASYLSLKKRCKAELSTGLLILPAPEKPKLDPLSLLFDGVRKPVTAQQLLDCGVLDEATLSQLINGQKTVSDVSIDKKINLKGTGSISGVAAGPRGKISLTEAKKDKIMSQQSADLLLDAQAATGYIIDLRGNRMLTVEEACARGVINKEDKQRLLSAEAAVVGFQDPNKGKPLSVGQAMKKGLIDRNTTLRLLQAQESVGGILDPNISVFLPKETAKDRGLLDEDLYKALNQSPECYLDPDNQLGSSYVALKKRCKAEPSTGLLILPAPAKPMTVQGLRSEVFITDLVDANLLKSSDMENLRDGKLTSQDIELRLRSYLRGSTCIAGVYDESSDKVMPIYQAMKEGILRPGTSLELLEAQAASGFIIDPVKNQYLTVSEAYKTGLAGPEFKEKLLSAERAVTGYQLPGSDVIISLFQAIEKGLIEKGHGIRLLEAQIASGGIIDPQHSHRIEVEVAYKKGYFGEEMNTILLDEGDDTKGFFDPNTEDNLTYLQLKNRCITDKKTGLVLLPIKEKKKKQQQQQSKQTKTRRKRRVVIVDPDTNKEMTVREAYEKEFIDYATFVELSEQESEWEEITITATDGSSRQVIVDRKTGNQYDMKELLERKVIDQSQYDQYRNKKITLTQFAEIVTNKSKSMSKSTALSSSFSSSSVAAKGVSGGGVSSVTSSSISSPLISRTTTLFSAVPAETAPAPSCVSSMSSSVSSSKEYDWEETTVKSPDGTTRSVITDRNTGIQYDIIDLLEKKVIDQSVYDLYRSHKISFSQFAEIINKEFKARTLLSTSQLITTKTTTFTESSCVVYGEEDISTSELLKEKASLSITLAAPAEGVTEQNPVGAIFDTENVEKISITEAMKRCLIDSITALRLLEAQACTGGIVNPVNGRRLSIQEATRQGIIDDKMAERLKPAQKAYIGFEDLKSKRKMSAAEAMKEHWLPYEAGHRFMEFQFVTGGLFDPKLGSRRTIEDALSLGWLDGRTAQKLQNFQHHAKTLTCPKSKLKITYKEALDNCLLEENTGVRMLQASPTSSRGISSPYSVSPGPGSRSGSRTNSRRSSVDMGPSGLSTRYSSVSYSHTTLSSGSTS